MPLTFYFCPSIAELVSLRNFSAQPTGFGQLAARLQPHHQIAGPLGDVALGGAALSADYFLRRLAAELFQLAGDDELLAGQGLSPTFV